MRVSCTVLALVPMLCPAPLSACSPSGRLRPFSRIKLRMRNVSPILPSWPSLLSQSRTAPLGTTASLLMLLLLLLDASPWMAAAVMAALG